MSLRDEGEINKFPPGDLQFGQTTAAISSLNEAWLHTLDRCINDMLLSEVILPLMRNCFFGGAIHAVLLLQRGSWRSCSFGYCQLHYGRAAVVIPKAVCQPH